MAIELEKRKGRRPSPGTIYPVLKKLKDKGLLLMDEKNATPSQKEDEKRWKCT